MRNVLNTSPDVQHGGLVQSANDEGAGVEVDAAGVEDDAAGVEVEAAVVNVDSFVALAESSEKWHR